MLIEIKRRKTNRLYTEGELYINDKRQTLSVESTECMLPTGSYHVTLAKVKKGRKQIVILNSDTIPPWKIGLEHSWIGSKKDHCICIGQPLIPGALFKGTEPYERLYDRIEKCLQRKEPITLEISDKQIQESQPISHWLQVNP